MTTNEDPIIKKATPFAFTGEPKPPDPHEIDVDETYDSLHHTIGAGPTQAAPGNHTHKTKDITDFIEEGGIVTDHGLLSGLADDDHLHYHNDPRHALIDHTGIPGIPLGEGSDHGRLIGLGDDDHVQYHNNARGDARYPLKTNGTGANGTWPINITGNAGSVDGQSFSYSNPGGVPTYFWGKSYSGDTNQVYATSSFARASHGTHIAGSGSYVVTTNSAGNCTFYTAFNFTYPVICNGDSNAQPSGLPRIHDWWNNGMTVTGMQANSACRLNLVAG